MQGFDTGAIVHWIGQYNDDNVSLTRSTKLNMPVTGGPNNPSDFPFRARKVAAWTTLDLIASYTFNLPRPVPAEVPGFAKDAGKNVKMKDGKEKNVTPVSAAECFENGYDESLAPIKGRFWYVQLKKRF